MAEIKLIVCHLCRFSWRKSCWLRLAFSIGWEGSEI